MSQTYLMQPHAGQRRYHDFSKLRAIHLVRHHHRHQHRTLLTRKPTLMQHSLLFVSGDNRVLRPDNNMIHLCQQQHRTIFGFAINPINAAIRNVQLKRLERAANTAPDDPDAQYAFLRELARDHPQAVLARMKSTNFAMHRDAALLYLHLLQRYHQEKQLHVDTLLARLHASELKHEINVKATKSEQVAQLQRLLTHGSSSNQATDSGWNGGTSPAPMGPGAAATTATTPSNHFAWNGGGMHNSVLTRGTDPKHPVHVQVTSTAGGGARQAIVGFVLRAGLLFVAFSAVGALLDDRGIGRGMGGINTNSKHVQEAEQDVRTVKFEDVKGVEEAKAELEEIVLYLKDPSRFTRLGGKLPRGLLLTGPPGTGKTLLAKAVAGEADVPFFYSSGSQFEEVYVGLGAKRVRELFEAAKKKSPCILFIDEIDALGGSRKLKDQSALKMTLNELLVQLDGFDENNGIIVIGATNFVESLDSALLRPGRFDKHVTVPLPDVGGRKDILEMYAKKTKLSKDVDLDVLARGTTGFSGADLFNLMNQAALKASVDGLSAITQEALEFAKDKIIMGAERKSAVITPETAKCTAYHEAGHAVVAVLTEGAMPIHKATIMPRGNALGMVTMLPEGDQTSQSLREMHAFMDVAMGGRVAEELVFGRDAVTSGASSDIQNATRIARAMVTKYGFSEEIGIVFHGGNSGEESASSETRARIDAEVKKLTEAAYKRAKDVLQRYSFEHKLLAETLLEYETLTGDEVRALVKKRIKPTRPVIDRKGDGSGGKRGENKTSSRSGDAKTRLMGRSRNADR